MTARPVRHVPVRHVPLRHVPLRHVELRRGTYRDSVRLMQISRALRAVDGVEGVQVAMATGMNVELAAGMGFTVPEGADAGDLLVAIAAVDEPALAEALARLELELRPAVGPSGPSSPADTPPRTVGSAVRRSGAPLVLVSTPGRYAFLDAVDALDAGASVMIFSDNVPVEREVVLKRLAAERGLLVLGPDCGTSVIGGVGLGFANVVRPGPVGIVAASGTGAQQVMCLLDEAGTGISHCLGVGGRDLSAEVGGASTLAALDALDADRHTELILVLSKPPAPEVADRVRAHAARLGTPVLFPGDIHSGGVDLTGAAELVLGRLSLPVPHWESWHPATRPGRARTVHGLFAGGTLCLEARAIAAGVPSAMVDLGADEYTVDRPHPMIDGTVRLARLRELPADAVALLDVVLGHGADPDPAATLGPAISSTAGPVVVALIGTDADPQGLRRQAEVLRDAGAAVFRSNAAAARHAAGLVQTVEDR